MTDVNDQFYQQQYDLPESEDKFLDTAKGEVIEKEDISPFEIIKAVAEQTGNEVRDPRPSCKHCYGRGYIGRDAATKMPIPCNCIYPNRTPNEKVTEALYDQNKINGRFNRKQRRRMMLHFNKELRKARRKAIKQEEKPDDRDGKEQEEKS